MLDQYQPLGADPLIIVKIMTEQRRLAPIGQRRIVNDTQKRWDNGLAHLFGKSTLIIVAEKTLGFQTMQENILTRF